MPTYRHPGVYIEEIPSGARPIESAGTSTAAIIGFATKGPVDEPELIFNWSQYKQQFGGIKDRHGATPAVDYMGHTVQAFFNNGGGKAYIVRVASDPVSSSGHLILPNPAATESSEIDNQIAVSAVNEGTWADGLEVILDSNGSTFNLTVGKRDANGELTIFEQFEDVSTDPDENNFLANIVNGSSEYIVIDKDNVGIVDLLPEKLLEFAIGQITSGEIPPPDFDALEGKKLVVNLDGDPQGTVTFESTAENPLESLEDVARQINNVFLGAPNADAPPKEGFTCEVVEGALVLTSGSNLLISKVSVTAGTPAADDAATLLKLLDTELSSSQTGEEAIMTAIMPAFGQGSSVILDGGDDGGIPQSSIDYDAVFQKMRKIRDANIILIPDHQFSDDGSKAIIDKAKAHAEFMETGMVIIDPPRKTELVSANNVSDLGLPASPYTALYYPWVEVVNPYYHPELRAHLKPTYLVPPSGFAAGMWAKIDGRRGVWKAPAGLGTGLTGAARTEYIVGNDEQDQLNPLGINCYRTILSEPVIWGARTLATKANPEKRYVPVQRTTLMLKESIFQGIQWAVFEPNDHNLWASLRLNIETFMDGLHRAGAFQGEKASDAYFVSCGLGSTMTQGDIDAGRVIVEVGFAPLKPAEFVIVRIQQKTAQL